jgi:hypothetical protein
MTRPFRCSDGLCGQEDCLRCHPEYVDDLRDDSFDVELDALLDEVFPEP